MKKKNIEILFCVLLTFFVFSTHAEESSDQSPEPAQTQRVGSAIDRRIALERQTHDNPFVITPHRPNYGLFTYTSSPNQAASEEYGEDLQNFEIKFQFSLKLELAGEIFGDNGYLFAAYTQKSLWQMFNSKISAPFRDTNHEPEVFLTFLTRQNVLGMTNRIISVGINHQSNGQSGSLSRSWNRLFAEFILERKHFYLSIKPWWRIPEEEKEGDPTGDDNPDITDYMGYGEVIGLYEFRRHRLGFLLRNLLSSPNRSAIQLDWSLPLRKKVRGYVQYFNGYGETLLDYNHYNNRIGIGVMLVDWI